MADFTYDVVTKLGAEGGLLWPTGTFRVLLCMLGSAAATKRDALTVQEIINAVGGLSEFNGAGYAQQVLGGMSTSLDTSNHRVLCLADPVNFGVLASGTSALAGALVVRYTGAIATSIPCFWKETNIVNDNPAGGTRTITWPATGVGILRAP